MEKSKRQRWRRVLGLKDVTPRRDGKSAEVIDTQRVVRQPSRKRVGKPLKRKDLSEKAAEMEVARGYAGLPDTNRRDPHKPEESPALHEQGEEGHDPFGYAQDKLYRAPAQAPGS